MAELAAALELATVVSLFFIILFLVLWCCCPLNKVEVELEAAPYSEEVGDTLAEELETGDEQPFTGTSLADDEDEPNFDTKRPFSPLIIVVNSSLMDLVR
jgi:hypothetical protein